MLLVLTISLRKETLRRQRRQQLKWPRGLSSSPCEQGSSVGDGGVWMRLTKLWKQWINCTWNCCSWSSVLEEQENVIKLAEDLLKAVCKSFLTQDEWNLLLQNVVQTEIVSRTEKGLGKVIDNSFRTCWSMLWHEDKGEGAMLSTYVPFQHEIKILPTSTITCIYAHLGTRKWSQLPFSTGSLSNFLFDVEEPCSRF